MAKATKTAKKAKKPYTSSVIKWFNLYEGNGLSKPYQSEDLAAAAAERNPDNYIETFQLDLSELGG